MTPLEIKAELSMRFIELEQAIDLGLPHAQLIKIYREIKELQYQLTIAELPQKTTDPTTCNELGVV